MTGGPALRFCALVLLPLLAACNQMNLKELARPDLKDVAAIRSEADKAYTAEDWVAAETAYRKLTEIVPTEADNWFRLGNIYVRNNRPHDAIALYREALVRDPGHARAWHNLGLTQLRVATNTFMEMQQYIDIADPINQRAHQMVDGITRLLEEGQTSGAATQ